MHDHNCLNCSHPLDGKFCRQCGQKADTHRFTVKHVVVHDVMHGIFHLDKGFFYTAKQLLIRPGKAIREFIAGKRINHYNAFGFIILMVACYHLVISGSGIRMSDMLHAPAASKTAMDEVQHFMVEHYKLIVFATIPLYACATWLLFRRAGQNFAEHVVLNVYKQAGDLLLNTLILILIIALRHTALVTVVYALSGFVVLVYGMWLYYQYFRPHYKNGFLLFLRILATYMIVSGITGFASYIVLTKVMHIIPA